MSELLVGGRCGYAEILDDGIRECLAIGLRITVRCALTGRRMSIVRCIEHSDWVSLDEN